MNTDQLTAEVRSLREQVADLTRAILQMGPIKTTGTAMPSLITVPTAARMVIDAVRRAISEETGLRPDSLVIRDRHKTLIFPRHLALALAYAFTNLSQIQIGAMLGGLDHGMVAYACKNFVRYMETSASDLAIGRRVIDRLTTELGRPNWLKIGGRPKCLMVDKAA